MLFLLVVFFYQSEKITALLLIHFVCFRLSDFEYERVFCKRGLNSFAFVLDPIDYLFRSLDWFSLLSVMVSTSRSVVLD